MTPTPDSTGTLQCSAGFVSPSGGESRDLVLIRADTTCFIVLHSSTSHFSALVVCAGFNPKGQPERGGWAVTETWSVGTLCLITHKFTAACQEGSRELVPWKGQALCGGFT